MEQEIYLRLIHVILPALVSITPTRNQASVIQILSDPQYIEQCVYRCVECLHGTFEEYMINSPGWQKRNANMQMSNALPTTKIMMHWFRNGYVLGRIWPEAFGKDNVTDNICRLMEKVLWRPLRCDSRL